jgi:2,3-bisphosphoglycerate-dependent phosphoglycerate mutase
MISAHGNSIRSMCKFLFQLDNNQITKLEIPTGNPLILKFDEKKELTEAKYLDQSRAKDLIKF